MTQSLGPIEDADHGRVDGTGGPADDGAGPSLATADDALEATEGTEEAPDAGVDENADGSA